MPECEDAFNALKHRLTSSPILAFLRFDVEFIVDCDVSGEGLGAVLSQSHIDESRMPVLCNPAQASGSPMGLSIVQTVPLWEALHRSY